MDVVADSNTNLHVFICAVDSRPLRLSLEVPAQRSEQEG